MDLITIIIIVVVALIIGIGAIIFIKRRQGGESGLQQSQVYVGNLAYRVREQQLRQFFSKYGRIRRVKIVKNTGTGRSKGFAFVTYASGKEADKSLAAHGEHFHGRSLVVRIAKPRQE